MVYISVQHWIRNPVFTIWILICQIGLVGAHRWRWAKQWCHEWMVENGCEMVLLILLVIVCTVNWALRLVYHMVHFWFLMGHYYRILATALKKIHGLTVHWLMLKTLPTAKVGGAWIIYTQSHHNISGLHVNRNSACIGHWPSTTPGITPSLK